MTFAVLSCTSQACRVVSFRNGMPGIVMAPQVSLHWHLFAELAFDLGKTSGLFYLLII